MSRSFAGWTIQGGVNDTIAFAGISDIWPAVLEYRKSDRYLALQAAPPLAGLGADADQEAGGDVAAVAAVSTSIAAAVIPASFAAVADPAAAVVEHPPAVVLAPVDRPPVPAFLAERPAVAPPPVQAERPPPAPRPVQVERPPPAPRPVQAERPPAVSSPVQAERPPPASRPVQAERPPAASRPVQVERPPAASRPVQAECPPPAPRPVQAERPPAVSSPVQAERQVASRPVSDRPDPVFDIEQLCIDSSNPDIAFDELCIDYRDEALTIDGAKCYAGQLPPFLQGTHKRPIPDEHVLFAFGRIMGHNLSLRRTGPRIVLLKKPAFAAALLEAGTQRRSKAFDEARAYRALDAEMEDLSLGSGYDHNAGLCDIDHMAFLHREAGGWSAHFVLNMRADRPETPPQPVYVSLSSEKDARKLIYAGLKRLLAFARQQAGRPAIVAMRKLSIRARDEFTAVQAVSAMLDFDVRCPARLEFAVDQDGNESIECAVPMFVDTWPDAALHVKVRCRVVKELADAIARLLGVNSVKYVELEKKFHIWDAAADGADLPIERLEGGDIARDDDGDGDEDDGDHDEDDENENDGEDDGDVDAEGTPEPAEAMQRAAHSDVSADEASDDDFSYDPPAARAGPAKRARDHAAASPQPKKPNNAVDIRCAEVRGLLDVAAGRMKPGAPCIRLPDGRFVTGNQFEKLAGKASARKWKQSCRLVDADMTVASMYAELDAL